MPLLTRRSVSAVLLAAALGSVLLGAAAISGQSAAAPAAAVWLNGKLHTHSLWSDGDDYPEMIAAWYKEHGYHFLALSDHNVIQEGHTWFELKTPVSFAGEVVARGGGEVLQKYLAKYGADWVQLRETAGRKEVRLKPLAEYRSLLEEPGRFLMVPSEEITSNWIKPKTDSLPERRGSVHINVTNPHHFIAPTAADNAVEIMQKTVDAVIAQRESTGQPMFAHINHPNFNWGITAEELMQVKGEKFFEVYNGHPRVNNEGDATRLSTDVMWDVMLTKRLTELKLPVVYGIGVDDSHHYHKQGIGQSNSGRGWVMVRTKHLTAESIIAAMEAGDFYASSGVTLRDVQRANGRLAVDIEPEAGVSYTIQFIGTRRQHDPRSEIMNPPAGEKRMTQPHRRYSQDIGAVLDEVKGTHAEYKLKGDEIYVRAKILSSKPKVNGSIEKEFESAWTQPLVNER